MINHIHYLLGNKGAHLYNGNPHCEKCERTFKSAKTLKNHKCAYCNKCRKIFSSFQKYVAHKKLCSPIESDKKPLHDKKTPLQPTSGFKTRGCANEKTLTSSNKQKQENTKNQTCGSANDLTQESSKNKIHTIDNNKNRGITYKQIQESAVNQKQSSENKRTQTSAANIVRRTGANKRTHENADIKVQGIVKNEVQKSINNKTVAGSKRKKEETANNNTLGRKQGASSHTHRSTNIQTQDTASNHTQEYANRRTPKFANGNEKSAKLHLQRSTTVTHSAVKFLPIDLNWQFRKCEVLGLTLHHGHSLTVPKEAIGAPKILKRMIGDGNCFFRAISFIVSGSEINHQILRQKIVQHILQNEGYMKNVLGGRDVQTYIAQSHMETNTTWATENEIFATAHLLRTNIYVYGENGENRPWAWLKHSPCVFLQNLWMENCNIYLQNTNRDHYDVVMDTTVTRVSGTPDSISSRMERNALKEIKIQIDLTDKRTIECESLNEGRKTKAKWMTNKRKDEMNLRNETFPRRQKCEVEDTQMGNTQRQMTIDKNRNKLRMQRKRMNTEYREKENEKRRKTMEKDKNKIRMQLKRKSDENRLKEKELKLKTMDREQEKEHKQEVRKITTKREKEKGLKRKTVDREQEKEHKQDVRKSTDKREIEKELKRKTMDREQEKVHKHEVRKSTEKREIEKELKRKTADREQEKKHKQEMRKSTEKREKEKELKSKTRDREQEKKYRIEKRKSKENRETEKELKRKTMDREQEKEHKQMKRKSKEYREKEELRRKKDISFCKMIEVFHAAVEEGPEYICVSCEQLWYRHSVRLANFPSSVDRKFIEECTKLENSAKGKKWICNTCYNSLKQGRIPALSIANIGHFPDLPECLRLTGLEERLAAARIPFMQLHQLPRGGQLSIHGNIVNVPTNVTSTVSLLPRRMSDDQTIPLKLKRKLQYGHHYQYQTVRPNMVVSAVKWLVENSSLYKEEGITIDDKWMSEYEEHMNTVICQDTTSQRSEEDKEMGQNQGDKSKRSDDAGGDDSDAEWDERQHEDLPAGSLDTMLQAQDLLEESREIMSLAPGEGNHPMNIFIDKHSEVLSFPSLYAGQSRVEDAKLRTKVHYSELCKSELRNKDRRVAGNMPNIFYKMKKLQMNHIRQKAMICLRKNRGRLDITAGDLKSPDFVNKLIQHDDGYRVFKELRGSPPYWEQVKKDLFALIRFLGIPTWFASFSSAETRWEHLLKILGKTVEGKTYTTEEVQQLTWLQKSELIKKDPVTCARHFEYQVQALLHKVLFHRLHPIGKVKDYFYKVEFQMRGSPHIHMLVWIEDAPNLENNTEEEVVEFVDQFITCAKDEDVSDLVNLQEHSHSRTCRKGGKKVCRFDFPQPPLDQTVILDQLPDDIESKEKTKHKRNWERIQNYLNESKKTGPVPFADVLKSICMDEEEYMLAIRSTLTSKKIFLRRNLSEARINNYNTHVLQSWRANMDLQYVIDAFSCAMYIVSYISKSQRGMSNLLYNACKEAREGNADLKKQVYTIGNKFLNNVEISAQEAVYFILQIPLHKASRDVVFVNTSPPERRVVMLKSHSVILGLEDESRDVEAAGIITHYSERPECLDDMCLADYASKYKRMKGGSKNNDDDEDLENNDEKDQFTREQYNLKGGYRLKKRQRNAPLRYVRYSLEQDREDHFREILLLFRSWRNEECIIGQSGSFEEEFQKCVMKRKEITEKMEEYNHYSEVLEKAMKDLEEMDEYQLEDEWDKCVPNAQHIQKMDEEEGVNQSDTFPEFLPTGSIGDNGIELQEEVGGVCGDTGPPDVIVDMMAEEDYYQLLRSLNTTQREFFTYILHRMKTDSNPFHIFLTGGAGVGKSVVVTAIHQALLRFLNKGPDNNPDDAKILLGAPTGIAAFLIKGSTLHSLFHIPAN